MKIIIDAFGGDNAPLEIIKGAADAVSELGAEIILVGDEKKINEVISKNNITAKMEIYHADDVISMEDDPTSILKAKSGSSMAVGLKLLSEGKGDAFVSAGSTGALLAGASLIVKRIKGIKRAALASIVPTADKPALLIDCGATVEAKPEYLVQFGVMGSVYMDKIMDRKNPRVALLNNGTEETKGTELQLLSHIKLKELTNINFIGNIEAREAVMGGTDVIVADGFTGNVILKMYEGVASAILGEIKNIFLKNTISKLSYLGIKSGLSAFKSKMDYKEYGGAPFIGLTKPVIKAHGASDARAIKNAVRQAIQFIENNVISEIEGNVE